MPPAHSRRGTDISRQFTDSERAVDERVTAHLTQPPLQYRTGNTIGQSYKWLQEDLKMRGAMTQVLGQEQDMAYQQSARHELARQVEENDKDEAQALTAVERVHGMLAPGGGAADWDDAVSRVVAETPGLALSDRFSKFAAEGSKFYSSDADRELAKAKQDVEMLGLGSKKFDLEAYQRFREENPDSADRAVAMIGESLKNQEITSANAGLAAQIEQIKRQREFDDIKSTAASWESSAAGLSSDPAERMKQFDQMAPLVHSFEQNGLGGVDDPAGLVKRFGGSATVMGMLQNKNWLNTKLADPQVKQGFVEALNVLNDDDPNMDPAVRRKASNLVLGYAGDHNSYISSAKQYDDRVKALGEVSEGRGKVYSSVSKSISDIVTSKVADGDNVSKQSAIAGEYEGFLTQFRNTATPDSEVNKVVDTYRGYLSDISGAASGDDAAGKARDLMGNFAKNIQEVNKKTAGDDPRKAPLEAAKKSSAVTKTIGGVTYEQRDGQWYKK